MDVHHPLLEFHCGILSCLFRLLLGSNWNPETWTRLGCCSSCTGILHCTTSLSHLQCLERTTRLYVAEIPVGQTTKHPSYFTRNWNFEIPIKTRTSPGNMFSGLFKLLIFLSVAAVQFATHRLLITELDSVDRQQSSELLKYPKSSADWTWLNWIGQPEGHLRTLLWLQEFP